MAHVGQTPQASAAQAVEDTAGSQPENIHALGGSSGESNGAPGRETRSQSSSMQPLQVATEGQPTQPRSQESPYTDFERLPPPPPARSREGHVRLSSRRQTMTSNAGLSFPARNTSGIDYIVPVEKPELRLTIGQRLKPTIDNATEERNKCARRVLWTGYALNIAIGLQVFLGALTTGLAAAVTSARQAQVSTSILGGLSTLVASYLARARGSGEPDLSIGRVKDLEHLLRDCEAFQTDHAHQYGTPENGLDFELDDFRRRLEELMGNAGGERKFSPPGVAPGPRLAQGQAVP